PSCWSVPAERRADAAFTRFSPRLCEAEAQPDEERTDAPAFDRRPPRDRRGHRPLLPLRRPRPLGPVPRARHRGLPPGPEPGGGQCRLDLSQVMGLYEGKAGVRKFADILRGLPIVMRHLVTNVVIRGDGERARSECYVLAITGGEGQSGQTPGFYDDEFVKQN